MDSVESNHIDDWCYDNFGIQGHAWDCYYPNESPFNFDLIYIFLKQEDAVLFALKWL